MSESRLRATGAVLLLAGVPVFALAVWLATVSDFRTEFIGLDFAVIALPQLLAGFGRFSAPVARPPVATCRGSSSASSSQCCGRDMPREATN